MGVETIFCNQFFMGAVFCKTALCQNRNMVRLLEGGNPVGDDNGCLSPADTQQVIQNLLLCIGIHRGERIVQNQNGRIL